MTADGYYNLSTWQLFFRQLKLDNPNINFTADEVKLINITPYITSDTEVNTKSTLIGVPEYGREGTWELTHNRPDIGVIFAEVEVWVEPKGQLMKSDLLPDINARFGFQLTAGDIYDGYLNPQLVPYSVDVTIRETNPAFTGKLTVNIGRRKLQLETVMTNHQLAGINYPTMQTVKIQGPLFLYGYDFSYAHDELQALFPQGQEIIGETLDSFNRKVEIPWVNDVTPQDWNMRGSLVTYNGLISGAPVPANGTWYTHCVVISLDDNMCDNVAGYLVLHYNLPT